MGYANDIGANPVAVGTARVALPTAMAQEVILRASRENPAGSIVYVGDDTVAATFGGAGVMFDLGPGESVALNVRAFADLSAVATAAGCYVYVTVLS